MYIFKALSRPQKGPVQWSGWFAISHSRCIKIKYRCNDRANGSWKYSFGSATYGLGCVRSLSFPSIYVKYNVTEA